MSTFYKINNQSKIGYKELTLADLGIGIGNQTHIGLFADTLEFVTDSHKTSISKLIYNNSSKELLCFIDFIQRESGRIDAPKIRKGEENELVLNGVRTNSIVREIREIVTSTNIQEIWYLLWFGLTNQELVFFLFRENSQEFRDLKKLIPHLGLRGRVERTDKFYVPLLKYLENKTENSNIKILEELEIIAQTDDLQGGLVAPRFFDIEKARKNFEITGKKGEELIARYLEKLKLSNLIKDFSWMNEIKESGMPFDFRIQTMNNSITYTDVKTTSYTFEQGMIFSSGELRFISQNKNYHVYRVYDLKEENPSLRICENIYGLSEHLLTKMSKFESEILMNETKINSLKLAIEPRNALLRFNDQIKLNSL